jgi:hypothetical protein
MSDDAVPRPIAPEHTIATRAALLEREVDRHERVLSSLKDEIDRRFALGANTFAELRAEIARLRDIMDGKVSARHQTLKDEAAELEEKLNGKVKEVGQAVADLAEQVAPRATTLRLVGWVAAALFALGGPVASYILSSARAPDRAEVRDVEARLRALEMRVTTIDARLGARGAQP